jgi:predicted lipoprotein with Yx(FWY)xxD motif
MILWLRLFVVTLALALPLAVHGTAAQDDTFLKVAQDPAVGSFLTDAEGNALYLFTPDTTPGESTCYDDCATAWPPLAPSEGMNLPAGVPGELTTVERTDGTQQVAYNDIPLYYYAGDEQPGDINGQGLGGVWFIVPPGAAHGPYPTALGEGTPVPASNVQIGFTEELGSYLTDADGRTVYLFTKDETAGESACYDDCATAWPPVPAADGMLLPPGISGTLSAIDRTDGSQQMTYNDIPLYYYAKDDEPGDTYGQEVGDVWYVVTPGMQFGDEPHEGGEEHEEGEEAGSATPASS